VVKQHRIVATHTLVFAKRCSVALLDESVKQAALSVEVR
jgi:hypothetical protein